MLVCLSSVGLCPANWTRADGVLDIESMLKPGRVLGHYRIERELGRGTFGCVLAAQDLRLHRQVALKVIRKTTTESESNLLNEARSAAAVNHPNVCTIYAVEEIDGLPTIVMEYLDGIPLDRYIANGFGDSTFKTIARGLASGLAAAHKAGIIHGDLKPANVILRNSSEPVILDFGLARLLQQHPTSAPPDSNQREASSPAEQSAIESTDVWQVDPAQIWISQDPSGSASTADYEVGPKAEDRSAPNPYGKISGTPAYMSPEQARGAILSEATDIFSLGQIFAEMLTGVRPLDKMGPLQIFQTLQKPEFVSSIAKNLPAEYQELVASMLTIEPANRPTAQEVAQKL